MSSSLTKKEKLKIIQKDLDDVLKTLAEEDDEFAKILVESIKTPFLAIAKASLELGEENHSKDIAAQLTVAATSSSPGNSIDGVWRVFTQFLLKLKEMEE